MSAAALAPLSERQTEDAGAKLEAAPLPEVNRIIRYVITHPARGWNEPKTLYWGYKISECQRAIDHLPQLTPAELKLVAKRVDELLGK